MSASVGKCHAAFVVSVSLFLSSSIFAASTSRDQVDVRGNPWHPKGKPAEISGTLTVIVADDFVNDRHGHFNFVDGGIKRNGRNGKQQRYKLELQGHLP